MLILIKRRTLIIETMPAFKRLLFALFCLFSSPSFAVNVLGFAIDEKIQLGICKVDILHTKSICWVGNPFIYKGSKSGFVHVPDSAARPKWAAFGVYEIDVDKSQILRAVKVTPGYLYSRDEVISSISHRFGDPTVNKMQRSPMATYTWDSNELFVQMVCSPECSIRFLSKLEKAAMDSRILANQRRDAARPIGP